MYKNIFDDFDKIKAPKEIVDKTVQISLQASNDENVIPIRHGCKKIAISALAACLALVFTLTVIIGINKNAGSEEPKANRFIITANAKQVELLGDKVSKSTIGAYSEMLTGGWAMYSNLEKYEDYSPNFFQSFALNMFEIEGEDIVSVTFKANSPGMYFAISPAGYFASADEETVSRFSEMSLNNSQYTAEELKTYGDGLSYGKTYCDTVTFLNLDSNEETSKKIDFNNKFEMVLESNHDDAQMSQMLDRLWACEQELLELRKDYTYEGGKLSAEEEKLWAEADELTQNIRGRILVDSTVDVTVMFGDGTSETKILKTDLVNTDDQRMWLTISEE